MFFRMMTDLSSKMRLSGLMTLVAVLCNVPSLVSSSVLSPSSECLFHFSESSSLDPHNAVPFMTATVAPMPVPSSVRAGAQVYREGKVHVWVELNHASALPEECFMPDGFQFHVHEFWKNEAGWAAGDACGAANTGGHYDPTMACGPMSGSQFCENKGGALQSSTLGGQTKGCEQGMYRCNKDEYKVNPYVCEVGDWSSKVGLLKVSKVTTHDDVIPFIAGGDSSRSVGERRHFWVNDEEVAPRTGSSLLFGSTLFTDEQMRWPCLLEGRSIVFHCSNGERVFCAKFEMQR
eukprot:GHVS01084878.1.p1 GENE.GHVS01084878.1~~GHVS01084878.1.p1  ORF type:complete len:291 (+),score=23.47 GHVS01084878.1:120-992(+)